MILFYLEGRITERNTEGGREREIEEEIGLPVSGSLSKLLQWLDLGHTKDGSQEFHPGHLHGFSGPDTLVIFSLLFWAHYQDWKWNSQDTNWCPYGLLASKRNPSKNIFKNRTKYFITFIWDELENNLTK